MSDKSEFNFVIISLETLHISKTLERKIGIIQCVLHLAAISRYFEVNFMYLWYHFVLLEVHEEISKTFLMIRVFVSFSLFKLFNSFVSLCYHDFKDISQIFLFILEISLVTKFFNVKYSTCNMLFVMFSKLSCSFAFCVDVSPNFAFFL